MRKLVASLILVCFVAGTAAAQSPFVRNDNGTAINDNNLGSGAASVDAYGRLRVSPFGAVPAAWFTTCSASAVTTNTQQTLKSAVAATLYNVTAFNCTNTGAAATRVELRDLTGSTVLANLMLPATTGSDARAYLTPIRPTAVNHGLEINVLTTGSSTICCISGYTSAD